MSEKKLQKNDFYNSLKQDALGDRNIIVDFEVVIDNTIIDWHFREIKNIIFRERVVIRDVEINSGLFFINCEFINGIVFHKVTSTNYSSIYNSKNCSVLFSNCIASIIVFETNCFFARKINIENNCRILGKIDLKSTKIVNAGFSIKESNINYIDISNSEFDINFSRSTFLKPLRVESLNGNITLISNEFSGWLKFWNVECNFSFTLNKNTFKDKFNVEGSRIKNLAIHGDVFEKKGEFENRDLSGNSLEAYLHQIYITEAKFTEGFDFNGLGKSIEKITLPITPEFVGVLKFVGWKVDNTYISGINQNLKLLFKSMSFRFFMINDFTNYSDISFDKCNGYDDSTLNLSDCDLGSTKFNEFAFDSFIKIRINNATLDKIKPTSSNWFKEEALEIGDGTQSKQDEFKRKREVYRQIKQALKSNGNQIDSLTFQAREMSSYRNELKNSQKYKFADRIVMSVSQSNDYGLNWEKTIGIVFLVTFIFYLIILPSISNTIGYTIAKDCSDLINTWDSVINNSKLFWQLFNPIRQVKVTYGENIDSGWIYFIDLIHRIFLGIMFFQIIKAFRKYVSN
nr:hypothetical protein [uncultured Flavobacterium sp.]